MKALAAFVRTTLTGFVLFLLPLVVLIIVIGKAQRIATRIMIPLAGLIPVESVRGIVVARLLAAGAIVLFCFLAGLAWRIGPARSVIEWLERTVLSYIPGYGFFKGMCESLAGFEERHAYPVVLARIEEAWQIGFLMESLANGYYAVFVPGAPSAWSGSVYFMTEDRFKRIDMPRAEALQCLRRLGIGAAKLLDGKIPR